MTEVLTLQTSCLFSKWGFNDGDEPDWLLVPALNKPVAVYRIETIHNPGPSLG